MPSSPSDERVGVDGVEPAGVPTRDGLLPAEGGGRAAEGPREVLEVQDVVAGGMRDGSGPDEDHEVRRDPRPFRPFRFACIAADPPWQFRDKLSMSKTPRAAEANYTTMPMRGWIESYFESLNVGVADDAFLFLWRVAALQEEAFKVLRAWGFRFSGAEITWVKTKGEPYQRDRNDISGGTKETCVRLAFGMGHYVRNCHEVCLICTRGKAKVSHHSQRSVFFATAGAHSEKPAEFYAIVEKLCPGPRLELFGRKRRSGWTVMGDEVE